MRCENGTELTSSDELLKQWSARNSGTASSRGYRHRIGSASFDDDSSDPQYDGDERRHPGYDLPLLIRCVGELQLHRLDAGRKRNADEIVIHESYWHCLAVGGGVPSRKVILGHDERLPGRCRLIERHIDRTGGVVRDVR